MARSVTDAQGGRIKPFTLNQRKRLSRQDGFGHRCRNNWHMGDLPAPWAEGDLVYVPEEAVNERLRDMAAGYFVVSSGFSIDEGDAWYFRVRNGGFDGSDRLHVAFADRSSWDEDKDWMAGFQLVETADPEGLALREKLLEEWTFEPRQPCPTCGRPL